ncbi:MAG: methyltransferase domain-containing protein [Loktanella sp.]|nr:methyltransferase domain-containing protein [Loktanella sp.]
MSTHLAALYASADDPWNTRTSPYEQDKFAQTIASLPRPHYRRGLEVGCGAGALTAHLARRCDHLIAMDCTERAVAVAQSLSDLTHVVFTCGTAPADWPRHAPDVVILSEVLYFLTDAENAGLAARISDDCTTDCDIVLVNWLGDTSGPISGAQAAVRLTDKLSMICKKISSECFHSFRIDVLRKC